MIEIRAIVKEVRKGMDGDALVVTEEKRNSTIKLGFGEADDFNPDDRVTIVIERDLTLRDQGQKGVEKACKEFQESIPEGDSVQLTMPGREPVTVKGTGRKKVME